MDGNERLADVIKKQSTDKVRICGDHDMLADIQDEDLGEEEIQSVSMRH